MKKLTVTGVLLVIPALLFAAQALERFLTEWNRRKGFERRGPV